MANLLESYKNRLAISESVYSKAHNGEKLSNFKKMATARCLDNVNRFMNEAFENSVGTQRADLGAYKKFALNLTTVALPNLIAFDLVIVYPMSSISGFINYVQYTAGSTKGGTAKGDILNDPFRLGKVDAEYTSDRVVETLAEDLKLSWTPVAQIVKVDGVALTDAEKEAIVVKEDGTITAAEGKTLPSQIKKGAKVAYIYDNVVVPQNDIPLVNAKMESIALVAKARRVAVYYSQIAAFQAKTDYGFDLGDQLAEKAVGQLSYEIDTEITNLLIDNAASEDDLVWSKTLPVGVSKTEHYEGFVEILEVARQKVYDRTKRFAPNYMLIASNVLPILTFIKGFSAAPTGSINGPYFAGTLNGLKVFVTPNIEPGKFVIGVNGDDMMSSAAVYAPYMAVVPTQLLGFADGGMSQGFSTMYDLKLLNKDLLVAGRITA
jgi:hypothetical protein